MSAGSEPLPGAMLDEQRWKKTLTWRQGFYFAFPLACGAFVSTGFMIGALGAWGALLVAGVMGLVALLSNFLFAEMATMFPEKPGSLSMYAREGMRRHFVPGGVLGAYGYWLGYSLAIGFNGLMIGQLIQAQWFADQTWTLGFVGGVQLSLAHFIAIGLVVCCWILTLLGIRLAASVSIVVGIVFLVVIAIVIIGSLVPGRASAANLTFTFPGWTALFVWFYIGGWTLFSSEMGAAFAPEYRDTKRDVPRVLVTSSVFIMIVFGLTPLSATAELGADTVAANPLTYGPIAAASVLGGGSQIFTILLVAALCVVTLLFMSDAGRATAGMAEEGDTIKQLGKLNRFGAPTWGTHVVAIVNIGILLFVANPVGIILASNLGYILAHSLANWSFVILRKTRPDAPRPLKLKGPEWMPLAVLLGCFHLVVLAVGIINPGLAGYGGLKETLIGLAVLCTGLIFWVYRVLVQDRQPLRLRDRGDETPGQPIPMAGD